jgi:hypothetical protein
MIAGRDHDRIQLRIREQLLGILESFGRVAEQLVSVIDRALTVHGPQVADAAEIEFRIRLRRELQHAAVARSPVPAAYLADLYTIVCPDDTAIGSRGAGQQHGAGGSRQKCSSRPID